MDDGRFADYDLTVVITVTGPGHWSLEGRDRRGGVVLRESCEGAPGMTWNVAQYAAVIDALDHAASHGARTLAVLSPSELVVEQLNGRLKVNDQALANFHDRFKRSARGFEHVFVGSSAVVADPAQSQAADDAVLD